MDIFTDINILSKDYGYDYRVLPSVQNPCVLLEINEKLSNNKEIKNRVDDVPLIFEHFSQVYYFNKDKITDECSIDKDQEEISIIFKTIYGKEFNKTEGDFNASFLHIVIFAKSQNIIDKFIAFTLQKFNSIHNPSGLIFEWISLHKIYQTSSIKCQKISQDDLVGLDEYFDDLQKDIRLYTERKELLQKMGTMSGFNYLLWGSPGTGKSSFVKAIAHKYKSPIYFVKLDSIKSEDISKALCPRPGSSDTNSIIIILIEDFDRYLVSKNGQKQVSHLLNALDSIYPGNMVIRFFSANFPENININKALVSRMRRMLHFDIQPPTNIFKYLYNMFPQCEVCIHGFIQSIKDRNLSLRTINNYISRFLLEEKPIEEANKHINEWFDELDKINMENKKIKLEDNFL
jgi:AAA+ superfamily predicted ATPase